MQTDATGEPHDVVEARVRAGQAIRRLGHAIIGRTAAASSLHDIAESLDSFADSLETGAPRSRQRGSFGYSEMPDIAPGTILTTYPDRPYSGHASPLAVGMTVIRTEEGVETTIVLEAAHEGAPERSDGGVVAAIFDDLTGFVLQTAKTTAFTGELTVRYEAGFPIGEPIVFRAWLERRVGRKLFINADAHAGEQRLATCKTIYIAAAF
jgi:hypothetical protein